MLVCGPAAATQKPDKIAITPSSKDGALMLRATRLPIEYELAITRYDPAEQALGGGIGSGYADVVIKPAIAFARVDLASDFVMRSARPGTYVLRAVSQQAYWSVCFAEASLYFTVRPGEVVVIGDFDGATPVAELHGNVMANPSHRRVQQGTIHAYLDNISPPKLTAADAPMLAAATARLRVNSPKTMVAPTVATLETGKFGTGYTLFGQKAYGAFFKKKVAKTAAQ